MEERPSTLGDDAGEATHSEPTWVSDGASRVTSSNEATRSPTQETSTAGRTTLQTVGETNTADGATSSFEFGTGISSALVFPDAGSHHDASSQADETSESTLSTFGFEEAGLSSSYVASGLEAGVGTGTMGENTEPPPWEGAPIVARSGFIDVEATDYLMLGFAGEASPAKLFFSFRPADSRPDLAPTFVFFNGGPGFATSIGLMAYGTGPMTVTMPSDGGQLVPNPWSWSQLGNLLYIDTRQAGFSYSTLPDPSDASARSLEASDNNFNEFVDAADILRVLLRVLRDIPGIRDNTVVLVGESYGGVRASFVLQYLLDFPQLETSQAYRDLTLAEEIRQHFAAVSDSGVREAKDQFRAQVLIQPFVAHTQFDDQAEAACAAGSKEAQISQQFGYDCRSLRYFRDTYQIDEDVGWTESLDEVAGEYLMAPASLDLMLGVNARAISGLAAEQRDGAFRLWGEHLTPTTPAFEAAFGVLQPWDTYHVALTEVQRPDRIYMTPYPCVYFSRVVAEVDTFVTNGEMDVVVDTPVLPTTLMKCQSLLSTPFVESITVLDDEPSGVSRPGSWAMKYSENSPYGTGERIVRWPTYSDSGHMVAVRQPRELFEDVRDFLRERGILP